MKDALLNYVKRVKERHEKVNGESATKVALIGPLFKILGYDLEDPDECTPEFKAPFGKGRTKEPVDWAFYQNGKPIFLVEAKDAASNLAGCDEQLSDYFGKVQPPIKLGILTNGVMWRFFTDIDFDHRMDYEPFMKWDLLHDEYPPYELLEMLHKEQFDAKRIREFAERRRAYNLLKTEVARLLEPSPEFTRLAVEKIAARPTPKTVEMWTPAVANAIAEWAKQRTPPKQSEPRPLEAGSALSVLIAAGILSPPIKLFRRYKGRLLEATLLPDGGISFQGQRYETCSAAAEAARATVSGRQMNTNGWTFWRYLGVSGKKLTLDDARRKSVRPSVEAGASETDPMRYYLRKKFWEGLLSRPKVKATRHANISPSKSSWIGAGSGVSGLPLNYVIGQTKGRVELWIGRGAGKAVKNKKIFDDLYKHKLEIERAFGGPLSWQRLDGKQGCRIALSTNGGYSSDESKWTEIQDAMIDAMTRLEKALRPHLSSLKAELALEDD